MARVAQVHCSKLSTQDNKPIGDVVPTSGDTE